MRYLQVILVFTTTFTHMVTVSGFSLQCDSNCAACWKNGDSRSGEDTKFLCNNSFCGGTCPEGYGWLHCASSERCRYVGFPTPWNTYVPMYVQSRTDLSILCRLCNILSFMCICMFMYSARLWIYSVTLTRHCKIAVIIGSPAAPNSARVRADPIRDWYTRFATPLAGR